jgi:aryl-alcohol dehydrogenase-like predicted oxidoreductase
MNQVTLGNTDIIVSVVGLGTVKFGRNQGVKYPSSFELPSDHHILDLLSTAQSLGINLLDTAPAYGNSEERLGKLLKGVRHEWIICGKAGEEFSDGISYYDFSPDAIRKSVERSLQRLNTDYIDILLIHSNGEDKKIIEENNVFGELAKLKQAGKIRAYGMSTKTIEGGLLTVDHADVVMVTYNPVQSEEQPVIAHAFQQHKGVFIKKALASGHVQQIAADDPVQVAMDFIFREPGVSSVIVGTLNKTHLINNVKCVESSLRA